TVARAGLFQNQRVAAFLTGEGFVAGRAAVGSGRFTLFDQLARAPKSLLSTGTWSARRLITTNFVGTFGGLVAGEIYLEVQLLVHGERKPRLARLKIVSNLPAAGLFTGDQGGVTLAIPGTPFDNGGGAGPLVTSRRKGRGFFLRV